MPIFFARIFNPNFQTTPKLNTTNPYPPNKDINFTRTNFLVSMVGAEKSGVGGIGVFHDCHKPKKALPGAGQERKKPEKSLKINRLTFALNIFFSIFIKIIVSI